ncbi:putative siderophore transport system ATP-binding protein YusV [Aquimixticola soesokkakensis]|uniref:Putative siderophore transport system ATP-binding protein YusV n=1 Tax=Aquimixticola soesokkakensis TaxID=1519096 RepID=A0A1Y5TD78_9RHOB|nr:ATP-binding cassette domain-containing protein [Aquimixticola soesokkakensis]SLN60903.1 putative siderophore transport system ATP-binding protein YusV [Aquimixticola soesokkakensis]
MISTSGLGHKIDDSVILNDISLDIAKGGITALIGPNGAGKSTLLHLISALMPVQSGTVQIDGRDLGKTPRRDLARSLAILTQSSGITSRLTVRDLVAFGRWPHSHGRLTAADDTAIAQALNLFELDDLAHRYIDELSGGQRQRAQVAMAYAQETDWLLLDEPLNNLDPRHAQTLMSRLFDLSRPGAKMRSVVIVIHEVNYAAAWADRVVAMKDGKLVHQGLTREVLTSERLSALYDTPIRVAEVEGRPFVLHHRNEASVHRLSRSA